MTDEVHAGLWINGKEGPAASGETFPVIDPGCGEVIGSAARGSSADVDRAVEAAQKAFRSSAWSRMTALERNYLLWNYAKKIEAEKDSLARLLSRESGKTLHDAVDDVVTAVRNFEYYAGWADKIYGQVVPVPERGVFDYILREPLGVVGHIIPWNYPLDIFARGLAPCLAIGNTVVVKPAEETPLATLELARLSVEAGFPEGVINVVPGFGKEAGAALASHPGIQGLAFCGSVVTGKEVLAAAAGRITPVVSLELGGKSACILFPDADVLRSAKAKAWSVCHNTGQSCGARSRMLVHESQVEQVADVMRSTLAKIRIGYGLDDPDMGPLVSQKQLDRVRGYIEAGQAEGAELLAGGGHPQAEPLRQGYYIEPALFGGAKPGMRIVEEEIFGPVIAILTYQTEEEAVALANASPYGLSAEIWTRDLARAHRVAAQLDVSLVTVNGTGGFGIETPFGGIKQSGFGREGGWESIVQYSRVKNVWMVLEG